MSSFGINYQQGGLIDKVVEAFAGSHDFIGGQIMGFYDPTGNARQGMKEAERTTFNTWAVIAIPITAPFAASSGLPQGAWNAIWKAAK